MQLTITFDLSKGKKAAIQEMEVFFKRLADEDAEEAAPAKTAKKTKPAKTVSPEEDEDFGTEAVEEEELEEDTDEESEEESEEEEPSVSFEEVKAALNKYGNKNPDGAKAILLSFKIKSTKHLEEHKDKYEPVYRKVMAALKAQKKGK